MNNNQQAKVCGKSIQHDKSGVGHYWEPATDDNCHAGIQAEIAGEIVDGDMTACDDYVASNGHHYRW